MGTKRAEQFNGFKNIGFTNAIGPYDQHAGMGQIQLQVRLVAEPLQRQLLKPDGSRSGVWVRYFPGTVSLPLSCCDLGRSVGM